MQWHSHLVLHRLDEQLIQVPTRYGQCLCPGDVVVYECTVSGGEGDAATIIIWRGGAFNCERSPNEITLLYNSHSLTENVSQFCNNGDIIARSVKVENTNYGLSYTSQLHVSLISDLINSWIECVYDNGFNEALVGSLNVTAGIKVILVSYNVSKANINFV